MAKQIHPLCPCGSRKQYYDCCGRFISGQSFPGTPEELMRSRYTAYTRANVDYIANTMKGPAAVGFNKAEAKEWAESLQWIRLKVLNTEVDPNGEKGFVEFIAVFREHGGAAQKRQEHSEFRRIDGRWYYWGLKE